MSTDLMGCVKSRSFRRVPMDSKKGGWLCHRRCFSPVTKSRVSTKGRLPSGDAPLPVTVTKKR